MDLIDDSRSGLAVPAASRDWRLELAIAAALSAVALWIHAPFIGLGLGGDDGYLAYGIHRIGEGEVLYRDFKRNYPPGLYYLFVPIFQIFGPDYLLTRYVWLLWLGALAGLTYLVARALAPRWAALWAGLVPVFLAPPFHKVFVPVAAIAGLAICTAMVRRRLGRRGALAAGVGIGIIALFRQDAGAYTFAIAALSIPAGVILRSVESRHRAPGRSVIGLWAALGGGVIAVWAPLLVVMAAEDALLPMFEQLVLDGVRVHAGMELSFPRFGRIISGPGRLGASLFYAPAAAALAAAALAAVALARRRFRPDHLLLAQWAAMTGLMHGLILFRSDMSHLRQILVLPALILAHLVGLLWKRARVEGHAAATWAARLALVGLIAWGLGVLVFGLETRIRVSRARVEIGVALDEPRARMTLELWAVREIEAVVESVRKLTQPGEPILVVPYSPIIYFLTDRPNPTPYDLLLPGPGTSREVQEEIIQRIESSDVRVVVLNDVARDERPERRFVYYAPVFARYLDRHFLPVQQIGTWILYARRS